MSDDKSILHKLKEALFPAYVVWFEFRLRRSISGEVTSGGKKFLIRKLSRSDKPIIDNFLNSEVEDKDLVFTGVKN